MRIRLRGNLLLVVIIISYQTSLFSQNTTGLPAALVAAYNDIKAYISNTSASTNSPIPSPPETHLDYCYPCDEKRKAEYARDSINFINTYFAEEIRFLNKVGDVLTGLRQQRATNANVEAVTLNNMEHEMLGAIDKIRERVQLKLNLAWIQYKDDTKRNFFIGNLLLAEIRHRELRKLDRLGGADEYDIIRTFVQSGIRIFTEAKKERDYPVLLNARQIGNIYKLAAQTGIPPDSLQTSVFEFAETNQFKIYVETESRSRGPDGSYQNVQLKSEALFVAAPDSNCRLKWQTVKPDTVIFFYELLSIEYKSKEFGELTYKGPSVFYSPAPEIKLDFCDPKRDSADFYGFAPYPKNTLETFEMPKREKPVAMVAMMPIYMMGFFDHRQYTRNAYAKDTARRFDPMGFGFLVRGKLVNKQKVVFDNQLTGRTGPMLHSAWFKLRIEAKE